MLRRLMLTIVAEASCQPKQSIVARRVLIQLLNSRTVGNSEPGAKSLSSHISKLIRYNPVTANLET
jgi:hypothetical protein